MDTTSCSVRMCRNPAEGQSPSTCQPLCNQHVTVDTQRLKKYEASVRQKVEGLNRLKPALRMLQQRLASDLLLLEDTFQELRETLDKCQKELTDRVTKHHEHIFDSMTVISELEDFQTELSKANETEDMRQVYLISNNMERSLETFELDSKLIHCDESTDQVKMIAYPDINARVKSITHAIEMQQDITLILMDNLDVTGEHLKPSESAESSENELPIPELEIRRWDFIKRDAFCIAVCNNTSGFVLDESGSVIRGQAGDGILELPQPTVFVIRKNRVLEMASNSLMPQTYFNDIQQRSSFKAYLISVNGQLFGKTLFSLDDGGLVVDIQSDNSRQILFVAQCDSVTATDLCGVSKWTVKLSDICCLTGNSDKLFVAVESASVFSFSKDSGEEHSQLPLTFLDKLSKAARIEIQDFMLTVYYEHKLYKVCTITEQLIETESEDRPNAYGCDTSYLWVNDSAILSLLSFGQFEWGLRIPVICQVPLVQQIDEAKQDAMENLRIVLAENNSRRKVFFILSDDGLSCFTLLVK